MVVPVASLTVTTPFEFDAATALTRTDPQPGTMQAGTVHTGAVHDGWDIMGNANGGYLMALAAAGMRDTSGRPDPVTVTAHYLAPAPAGPATVHSDVVKEGKRFTTVTGSLRSGERELIRVMGLFGDLASTADGWTRMDGGPPDLPPIDECVARSGSSGVAPAIMDRLDIRLRPGDDAFQRGDKTGSASITGWFSFADGRPIDTLSLLLVADAFPPPVFNIDIPAGWVPTIELTVHVRAVPAPGPLICRFATRFIQGGYLEEDGEIWDSQGRLVAMSRQLALVPR
jgi:acyl-coenzyme A thioesterase PaaI-like protein